MFPDGWINVKLEGGTVVALPEYLKVYVSDGGSNKERESIQILEGTYRGETATGKRKEKRANDFFGSYFDPDIKLGASCLHRGSAMLVFFQKSNILKITGVGEFITYMDFRNPIPPGTYDLEIPDFPHDGGRYYIGEAPHAKTWFRIGHSGDRYLHCGTQSNGCIAVEEIAKWETIYNHLILSRKLDHSVGTIQVINQ